MRCGVTKQEALDWFVHRKESIALDDRCQQAEDIAIEAIRKVIAMDPKSPKVHYNIHPRPLYECPDCGCGLAWSEQWRCKACPECGQMIDWEGFPPENPPKSWQTFMGYYDWRLIDKLNHERSIENG